MPTLDPLNAELWSLWAHVQTQWRAGGMGLIGLDWPAVAQIARWFGVDVRIPRLFTGLQQIEEAYLKTQQQGRSASSPADAATPFDRHPRSPQPS